MRIFCVLGVCFGLAACQETIVADKPVESCGSEEMSHLMGLPRAQLESIAFSQPHRILGEDDVMTMDYRGDRVNFTLNENGEVARIWCG